MKGDNHPAGDSSAPAVPPSRPVAELGVEELLLGLAKCGASFRLEGARLVFEVPHHLLQTEWDAAVERHSAALQAWLQRIRNNAAPCPTCRKRLFAEACMYCSPPVVGARVTLSWHAGSG